MVKLFYCSNILSDMINGFKIVIEPVIRGKGLLYFIPNVIILMQSPILKEKFSMAQEGDTLGLFEFTDHVQVNYDAVCSEPEYYKDGAVGKAFIPLTNCLQKTMDSVQVGFFYFLSAVIGSVLSVVWGITFGTLQFATVWLAQPAIKIFLTAFRWSYIISRATTRMCCDPFFESASILYSRIRGGFKVEMQGVNHSLEKAKEPLEMI